MINEPRRMGCGLAMAAVLVLAGGCAASPRATAPAVAAAVCPPRIADLADGLARHRASWGVA